MFFFLFKKTKLYFLEKYEKKWCVGDNDKKMWRFDSTEQGGVREKAQQYKKTGRQYKKKLI